MQKPTADEVIGYFDTLSNWGRWGADDRLGTLNLITPQIRNEAAALVRPAKVVSLSRDIDPANPTRSRAGSASCSGSWSSARPSHHVGKGVIRFDGNTEYVGIVAHGSHTHLDGLAHYTWDGKTTTDSTRTKPPRSVAPGSCRSTMPATGSSPAACCSTSPACTACPGSNAGYPIMPDELAAAEERQGVTVRTGDALLIHTGHVARALQDPTASQGSPQAGLHAACLPYLRERDVAVLGSDCIQDVQPSGFDTFDLFRPIHAVGACGHGAVADRQHAAHRARRGVRGGEALGVHVRDAPVALRRRHVQRHQPSRHSLVRPRTAGGNVVNPVLVVIGTGGMGAAIARRLGTGHSLVLADFDQHRVDALAEDLRGQGLLASSQRVDVSDRDSVAALAEYAASLGPVTGVAHTAGVSPQQAPVAAVLAVDLLGTALVLEEFGSVVADRGAGVVIASMGGHFASLPADIELQLANTPTDELLDLPCLAPATLTDSGAAYVLAKRANQLRVRAAAPLWGDRGARVNSISPGIISTPMGQLELASENGASMQGMLDISSAKRLGTPEDIAHATEFLLDPRSGFITGTDLLVDGGVVAALQGGRLTLPGA